MNTHRVTHSWFFRWKKENEENEEKKMRRKRKKRFDTESEKKKHKKQSQTEKNAICRNRKSSKWCCFVVVKGDVEDVA